MNSPLAPPQVLLYDPNFVSRVALSNRLEQAGCKVRAEKDISGAGSAARAQSWDLILANTGVPLIDLKSFLETTLDVPGRGPIGVVCNAEDRTRMDLAVSMKAITLLHPLRPSALRAVMTLDDQQGSSKWLPIVPKLEEPGEAKEG